MAIQRERIVGVIIYNVINDRGVYVCSFSTYDDAIDYIKRMK